MSHFHENYKKIQDLVLTTRTFMGQKGSCRYCGKNEPEVKFSKIAHSLPELIGNKYLFSNDECNECNGYFDQHLENNLANFLGLQRTISQVKGKKGIPKFKSKNGDRVESIGGDIVVIQTDGSELSNLVGERSIEFKADKNTFTPISVYKCFVKMALSVLPENKLSQFRECIEWVRYDKKPNNFNKEALKMLYTFVPGISPFEKIAIAIWEKRTTEKSHPHMICILSFSNHMFQFTIPFSEVDISFAKSKLNFIPYLMPQSIKLLPKQMGPPQVSWMNLTDDAPVKVEEQTWMGYEKWEEKSIEDISEIPEEIRKRIADLGLQFKKKL